MAYRRTQWVEAETPLSAENFNNIEDGVEEALAKTNMNYIANLVYPVGSIYMSIRDVNPGTLFGGTWVAWGQGRVPVGVDSRVSIFNEAGKAGGSADATVVSHSHNASFTGRQMDTHTHTFTGRKMDTHNHTQYSHSHSSGEHAHIVNIESTSRVKVARGSDTSFVWAVDSGSTVQRGTTMSTSHVENATAVNNKASAGTPSGIISNASAGTPSGTVTVSSSGASGTNANLQPYITCYMWKRTA